MSSAARADSAVAAESAGSTGFAENDAAAETVPVKPSGIARRLL